MNPYLNLFLIAMVLGAAFSDFRSHRIPNLITFPTMVIGMAGHAWLAGLDGWMFSLQGLAVGMGALFLFYALGGMAAGDVKLLGAVGAVMGPKDTFLIFLMTAILGGLYAIGVLSGLLGPRGMMQRVKGIFQTWFLTGNLSVAFSSPKNQPKLRYGLAIALGTLTFQFWYWIGLW